MLCFLNLQDLHSNIIILISRFKVFLEHYISNYIFIVVKDDRIYVQEILFPINQSYIQRRSKVEGAQNPLGMKVYLLLFSNLWFKLF